MTRPAYLAKVNATLLRVHGESVRVNGADITAIVDQPSALIKARALDGGTVIGQEVEQQELPTLWADEAAVASVTEGDAAIVRGTEYRVARLDPDGTGLTLLTLYRPSVSSSNTAGRRWR